MKHNQSVLSSVKEAALSHRLLTTGTILSAAGEVLATLLPPLLLARIVDDPGCHVVDHRGNEDQRKKPPVPPTVENIATQNQPPVAPSLGQK